MSTMICKPFHFFKAAGRKSNPCKWVLVALLTLAFANPVQAAPNPVRITVVDENNAAMQGVTISIKGKAMGVTRQDGSYTLADVAVGATLRLTFVGYTSQEVQIKAGQNEVKVQMQPSGTALNEVVVVNTGLYRKPAGSFTGASNTINGDELRMTNPQSVIKALSALDPSMRITENNALGSDPNSLPVIQLRGANNLPISTQGGATANVPVPVSNGDIMSTYLSNPNEPLIILDGFQATLQTLYDLDINRIDKITVLKDAAATVAYGSKAANGVIVVETKRPGSGKLQLSYSINVNTQVADLTSYDLMNAEELLEAQRLSGVYTDNNNHANQIALQQWYDYRLYNIRSGVNTYWLSQPVRNGVGLNHSLSLSGGNRQVRYSLSLGYNNSVGVMKGSNRTAFNLTNVITYSHKGFRISNNVLLSSGTSNNTSWGSYNSYSRALPFIRPYDSTGNMIKILEPTGSEIGIPINAPGGLLTNPMYNATLNVSDISKYTSFKNTIQLEYTINNNLRATAAFLISTQLPSAEQFLPADHTNFAGGTSIFTEMGSYNYTEGRNTVLDGRVSLDFTKRFNKKTLFISTGTTAQDASSDATTIKVAGIPNDYLNQLGMANGYGSNIRPSAVFNRARNMSVYTSASFNFNERYVAEVTLNASGSSQFGANNRLAPFWATGVAWHVDKEKFFRKNNIIQGLQLRATYGITGNQNFAAFSSQPIYQYSLTNNYRLQLGANLQGYANPNLQWQQTRKTNVQLTMQMFKGALNVNVGGFLENTNNLILPIAVAPSTGFTSYQDNLGATQNKGIEIGLTAPVIRDRKRNIFWSLMFNTGSATNIIKSLSPAIEGLNKINNDASNQKVPLPRYEVGESMSRIWAVRSLGIDPATGNELFLKRNGATTFVWDPVDKVPVGESISKFKGSFGSNLTYKAFTFNILLSFEYGGQVYNQTLVDKIENVDLQYSNADRRVLTDRWKEPGDQVFYKSITNTTRLTNATSRFVQDNNYIDASSISVGYNFPPNLRWVKFLHLSTPRIFITQNNVFRVGTVRLERGTSYPFARSFSFGLSTTF